jgi:hypothetical protein
MVPRQFAHFRNGVTTLCLDRGAGFTLAMSRSAQSTRPQKRSAKMTASSATSNWTRTTAPFEVISFQVKRDGSIRTWSNHARIASEC